MKTKLEIIKLVQDEFIRGIHIGICSALYTLELRKSSTLSHRDVLIFIEIYREYLKDSDHSEFFKINGETTTDSEQFAWKPYCDIPRILWFKNIIKKHS